MLREDAWDPLSWVYLIGAGLHPLLAREFAPLAERLLSVAGRLEGIPTILDDARATIGTAPRPVSRLHAEVAGKRVGGVAELGRQAVETAEAAAPGDPGVAAILPRLRAAADAASEALDAFGRRLTDEVAPSAAARPRWASRCSPTSCGTRCATRRSRRPRSSPGPRRSSRPSARRWSGSRATPGRRGGPVSRRPTTRARWSAACSTRSPATIRQPTSSSRTAARSSSGSRPSAASTRSSASSTSRSTSTGPPSSCARSAARCWTRPGRSTTARRRSSRSRRCPATGRPSSPSRTCAR